MACRFCDTYCKGKHISFFNVERLLPRLIDLSLKRETQAKEVASLLLMFKKKDFEPISIDRLKSSIEKHVGRKTIARADELYEDPEVVLMAERKVSSLKEREPYKVGNQ